MRWAAVCGNICLTSRQGTLKFVFQSPSIDRLYKIRKHYVLPCYDKY